MPAMDGTYGVAKAIPGAKSDVDTTVNPLVLSLLGVKRLVAGSWLLLTLLAIPVLKTVLSDLSMTISAPSWTDSGKAFERVQQIKPDIMDESDLIVLISCEKPCKSVVGLPSYRAVNELDRLWRKINTTSPGWIKYIEPTTYYGKEDPRISDDLQSMVFMSTWKLPEQGQADMVPLIHQVAEMVDRLDAEARLTGRSIVMHGLPTMLVEYSTTLQKDIAMKTCMVVPFMLGVLYYMLRSWRLILLCFTCLFMSVILALASTTSFKVYGPRLAMNAPAQIVFTGIAVSIDYSMFLLSRLREELQGGKTLEAALSSSMVQGGCVVAISGNILLLCYASNALLPGEVLRSIGLSGTLVLAFCMLISLTFLPSVIAIFPSFFTAALKPAVAEQRSTARGSRIWFRIGVRLTEWPFIVVVPLVIYVCMLPIAWQVTEMKPNSDLRAVLPEGPSLETYRRLEQGFPLGDPMMVIIEPNRTVKSDAYFEDTCAMIRKLIRDTKGTAYEMEPANFESIATVPNDFATSLPCPRPICMLWSKPAPGCPLVPSAQTLLSDFPAIFPFGMQDEYKLLWSETVEDNAQKAFYRIIPDFDMTSGAKGDFVKLIRNEVPGNNLFSSKLMEFDLQRAVYDRFPTVLAADVFVMFLLIGISFKAVLVPVKIFLTIVVPLAFTYGALTSVYQLGVLNWLGWSHLDSTYGLNWMVPVLSLPIVIGLAVDYDLFLYGRFHELRHQGFDNRAAVVGALTMMGPVISSAGFIMFFAFGGLLLTNLHLNCELGFVLSIGVLIDTFIVRTILMPSMLMLSGNLIYWPRETPEATRSLDNMESWLFDAADMKQPLSKATGAAGNHISRTGP